MKLKIMLNVYKWSPRTCPYSWLVAITILTWYLFVLWDFLKCWIYGRTDIHMYGPRVKMVINTGCDFETASWINWRLTRLEKTNFYHCNLKFYFKAMKSMTPAIPTFHPLILGKRWHPRCWRSATQRPKLFCPTVASG